MDTPSVCKNNRNLRQLCSLHVVECIFSHIGQISELLYFESFKDKPYGSKR